jgi:hypothetical protein
MSLQEALQAFESMLEQIARYQTSGNGSVETFLREYEIDFEPSPVVRPKAQGLSSSAVIREIREGRW